MNATHAAVIAALGALGGIALALWLGLEHAALAATAALVIACAVGFAATFRG